MPPSLQNSRCQPLKRRTFALALLCLSSSPALVQAQPQPPASITVSAAASLTNAFEEIAAAFEKSRPGVKVQLNFAASGPLLQQILQGAPVDVFASADSETMDRAAAAKVIAPGSRADFAGNALVLVLPTLGKAGQLPAPSTLAGLAAPAFAKIAIGNPATVPAGRYALQAINASSNPLASALQPRWIYADSVRQALGYVVRGEVDAGFVYRSDALSEKSRVRVAFEMPMAIPVRYPIATVARSKNPELARAFVNFVQTDAAQAILGRYGFDRL